jgi:small subunit ribosomal protein S1
MCPESENPAVGSAEPSSHEESLPEEKTAQTPVTAAEAAPEPETAITAPAQEPDAAAASSAEPNGALAGSSVPSDGPADATAVAAPAGESSDATPPPDAETSADSTESAEMDQLLDQYAAPHQAPSEGEIESGHVVAITDLGVVVDLGGKTEGLIPAIEIAEAEVPISLDPGQPIEVLRTGDRKDGYVVLSHLRARRRRAWTNIEKAYREKTNLTGRVVDHIKGGLVVDIGARAFLPASQLDLRPVQNLDSWKDQEIEVRVVKLNRKRGNVVVSRRAVLEVNLEADRQKLMDSLEEGQVRRGVVKNVTGYGAFIDLGGLDGLLHVTDMSWVRVASPSEIVRPGDEVDVQVLKFDRAKMRVSLGLKQMQADPWASVAERFPVGAHIPGKVIGLVDYGAFVEIEPGIEGLVHVSEMSWSKRKQHPSKLLKPGDAVEVVVLGVDSAERRISLGMKQAQSDPWQTLAEKYPVGTVVTGRVRNLTDFGAFVEIEEGFDGLVHVSDISWTSRVKNPSELLKKGDTIQAKVLKIDAAGRRVSLGIKQVNDIWSNWFSAHKVGDLVHGRVSRLTTFGAFVELADGIEGLCHISEIEGRRKPDQPQNQPRNSKSGDLLHVGQDYDFKIVKMSSDQHKIGLSYRAAQRQVERREMEDYRSSKSSATATIGDAIMAKREML